MFAFNKKVFFTGLTILSSVNFLTITPLIWISMASKKYEVRPQIVNVNSDELMKRISVNLDQMQAIVIKINVGMIINAGVNAKK